VGKIDFRPPHGRAGQRLLRIALYKHTAMDEAAGGGISAREIA
jgi:hypothetical protein